MHAVEASRPFCGKDQLMKRLRIKWLAGYQKHAFFCFVSLLIFFLLLSIFSTSQLYLAFPFYQIQIKSVISSYEAQLLRASFSQISEAYQKWDLSTSCEEYRAKTALNFSNNRSLQKLDSTPCIALKQQHVSILVKQWSWLPDYLDNLYPCSCGLTCLWTKSRVLADKPDAELYETARPPRWRHKGEPLRVYMDLEPGRTSSGYEDIFVSYHADDTVQATYAGAFFHNHRSYLVSPIKNKDILVYWSSSRCVPQRLSVARKLLSLLPHHSFGRCLNNVGGPNMILSMYSQCKYGEMPSWSDHLHCAMSHYKFVLAIENTYTESYVTEKLFYALDAGAVPIYFGAPNVWDFVPPNSIIDGSKFSSLENLAAYVKKVASDPVLYAQYHAWRRCGVMGNYHQTRAVSLDSLPCRVCAIVSKLGGKGAQTL